MNDAVTIDRLRLADPGARLKLAGVPDGMAGRTLADLARANGGIVFVARDGQRLAEVARGIAFFAPGIDVIEFPAWDCLPYDRVSPHAGVVAQRMAALARLGAAAAGPRIVLTTVNAAVQRVPRRESVAANAIVARPGATLPMAGLIAWLENNGFIRATTVREPGEYAVRGGIVDLFAPGADEPLRFDFFGDTLESIRRFDVETQRTTGSAGGQDLVPVSEMALTADSIARFRTGYVAEFGVADRDDQLYQAVSEGRRYPGMEHWMPLFADGLETLFDHTGEAAVVLDSLAEEALAERIGDIEDHYEARRSALDAEGGGAVYKPLPADRLYLSRADWDAQLGRRPGAHVTPFSQPDAPTVLEVGGRDGRTFAAERKTEDCNVFEAVTTHVRALQKAGKRTLVSAWSDGSRDRMQHVLADHGLKDLAVVESWEDVADLPPATVGLAVLGMEKGFEAPDLAVIGEQDILGDRLVRPRARRRPANFLSDLTSLSEGDVVVHVDHGIGRFQGLKTIEAAGAPHDCLELHYAGGDRVYLPVENIDLLTRYGSSDAEVALDKLGGVGWQSRRAKLKKKLLEMADALIRVAAERAMRKAPVLPPPDGLGDEFAARFPFEETEDQQGAIDAVAEDLAAGRPMDRLVCGDVGFGKTEVALRAAFVVAMAGRQVAILAPTTLLVRQHFQVMSQRFAGLPLRIEEGRTIDIPALIWAAPSSTASLSRVANV